ncbi:Dolichyl-diphosphooligosaccharide--protein glycosyltransferase subunit 4A [Morella rubra]|uniref:Dolichyl-diphosphooligosaccharide--protein glycosyltransferase subunit 4A n=1 Tax=Morella rubra TaxID=262757 RepID=A0A6A1W1A5_9ROSI|nr:Dolichyl-diphosphooligosaccharide--protein glycosyltransferase subunit 4A [Morella rubra]KAB1217930.1 Dolichyl-diphosphooligosaccharide--protein glycosyltransferase subunit 4A [Morella rubra]
MELVVSRGVVRIEMILSFETREIGFAYIDVEIDMKHEELYRVEWLKMVDDQDLGFFANFLGIFVYALVIAYHFVMADPKYEGS